MADMQAERTPRAKREHFFFFIEKVGLSCHTFNSCAGFVWFGLFLAEDLDPLTSSVTHTLNDSHVAVFVFYCHKHSSVPMSEVRIFLFSKSNLAPSCLSSC